RLTQNLTDISPGVLRANPTVLPMLRMATAPPIARDRLIGLAGVAPKPENTILGLPVSSTTLDSPNHFLNSGVSVFFAASFSIWRRSVGSSGSGFLLSPSPGGIFPLTLLSLLALNP